MQNSLDPFLNANSLLKYCELLTLKKMYWVILTKTRPLSQTNDLNNDSSAGSNKKTEVKFGRKGALDFF